MSQLCIIEALVPAPGAYSADRERCRAGALIDALIREQPWMHEREGILRHVKLGATNHVHGHIHMRLLAHVSVPLREVDIEGAGESFTHYIPDGEIFAADEGGYFYVTTHREYHIHGSVAFRLFRGQDGLEVPNLKDFMLPVIHGDLKTRVLKMMEQEELPSDAAAMITDYLAHASDSALLRVDVTDVAYVAEVIAYKLRTGLCFENLFQQVENGPV